MTWVARPQVCCVEHHPSAMRLPDFILSDAATILAEWDAFARSIWPGAGPSPDDLRDHAEAILLAAAWDMKSPQSPREQMEKSRRMRGARPDGGELDLASSDHALGRAASGFDLTAVMAEYRALRASVVRLWAESSRTPDANDIADLTRFHESIDQSLAEAVYQYSEHLDKSREMFLRILGHDLRNPLNAVTISAQSLVEAKPEDPDCTAQGSQILSSAHAIARMLGDFLDFAVSRLGRPMPVAPEPMDLAELCREVVDEMRATCPRCIWRMESPREIRGEWDGARMRQLLSNLIGNAVQHGDQTSEIVLSARTDGRQVLLAVHNAGPPIPEALLPVIFNPLVRGSGPGNQRGSVGLGLYIAREVAVAHGGTIEVASTAAEGTTFTVTLPLCCRQRSGGDAGAESGKR